MIEVSDVAIKRTQDSLGKIIKKPVLTEKLLRKPPFKFLHDIIHAVIKTSGFLIGLYTDEELVSENIKDRDAKIAFLQKAIDAIKLATKQDVRARPSKIVAGLEADKTNELLVAIAKAIDRKIDSTDAVALVKSGKVIASPKKEAKPSKTQTKTEPRKAKKDTKESSTNKKTKSTTDTIPAKKSESNAKVSKQSSKESVDSKKTKRSTSQNRDKEKVRDKEEDKKKTDRERTATIKTDVIEKQPQKSVEQPIEAPPTNGNVNDVIENQESKPNIETVETIVKQNDLPKDEPEMDEKQEEKMEMREKTPKTTPEKKVEANNGGNHEERPKSTAPVDVIKTDEIINEPPQPPPTTPPTVTANVAPEKVADKVDKVDKAEKAEKAEKVEVKTSNDKPRSSKSKKNHSKHDAEKVLDNTKTEEKIPNSKPVDKIIERSHGIKASDITKNSKPPRTALRSAAVRPISARPSAPRRHDRNVRQIIHTESFIQEPGDHKADKKNIMPEFDDADNIVITETIPDNISAIDEPITNNVDGEIDGKQGHLVQQILDTQTAILKADAKNDVSTISDESILNDRKSITRNMTELRKMIQKLSLYITPLGKMMEYFQEDVDAMQIELLMWQNAGAAAEADIKEEQRTTEKMLENFKYHLAEINNSIKDHAEQINNTTMNIIQNEEKISKLISTL